MSEAENQLASSREIKVRLAFAGVAAILGVGLATFTDVSQWLAFGTVIVLGIIVPRALLYLED
ncbi:hypothetical protein JCM30237_01510 [Halolamina litorea]|uniref:Uncharacterized protein n=1 Tax=Halolamina litorea TaxID=1515593 RepID=A0ABD6BT82_9EURY|nr:hypothetical protein [Halolamina litorea]